MCVCVCVFRGKEDGKARWIKDVRERERERERGGGGGGERGLKENERREQGK